jgi:hypothetical protein
MPLRLLLYVGRVYEKILDGRNVYRQKLIKIPKPDFIVLYNGDQEFPDKAELKLSDAFEDASIPDLLDLTVNVYNVNHGRNPDILKKSRSLRDYAAFIGRVKENKAKGVPLEAAIREAMGHCIGNGIMREFLEKHGSEVRNMLFTEFNIDDAQKVWFEEGMEKGLEKGMEKSQEAIALKMLRNGFAPEIVAANTDLPVSKVAKLAGKMLQ